MLEGCKFQDSLSDWSGSSTPIRVWERSKAWIWGWECGFECRRRHGFISLMSVVCCSGRDLCDGPIPLPEVLKSLKDFFSISKTVIFTAIYLYSGHAVLQISKWWLASLPLLHSDTIFCFKCYLSTYKASHNTCIAIHGYASFLPNHLSTFFFLSFSMYLSLYPTAFSVC